MKASKASNTSKPFIHFLLFAGALLPAWPGLATAWVERHDLSAAAFQAEFNRWTAAPYGLQLVCLNGYEENGAARYAAIWEKRGPAFWSAANGMTAAQFNALSATRAAEGYSPVFVSGFSAGGTPYFNAIWQKLRLSSDAVTPAIGLTRATLAGQVLAKAADGYTLAHVSAYTVNGVDLYAVIWSKALTSASVQCAYGLTAQGFATQFNTLAGQGFHLVAQSVAWEDTVERYSGVWRKTPVTGWYSYSGLSRTNYEGETLNAYYTGYRPTFVSVHTKDSASRFHAVWEYNGGFTPSQAAPLDSAIRSYMTSNSIPGLSLAISRNGRLVHAKGYGLADTAANERVHPHHRFRIASVSKPITAAAVLHLRDQNLLSSIDRTVFGIGGVLGTTYGTLAYSSNEMNMTVRQLLSHTSGWKSDGKLWDNNYGTNYQAILDWQLDNASPTNPPGTTYSYCNMNYCAAARILERLSGQPYEHYVKANVLAPCGISEMEIGGQTLAERKPNEVVYYQSYAGDPYVRISPRRMDGNGGWVAKPVDLLLFMRRLDGRTINTDILSPARLTEMRTIPPPATNAYGLGLQSLTAWWGHNGAMAGTTADMVHRADGIDFAVTCNSIHTNDSAVGILKTLLDNFVASIPGNWPDHDLFPSVNPEFDAWTAQAFPAFLRAQPGLKEDFWGPEADFDGDGVKNLMEAYFNLDPQQPSVEPFQTLTENGYFVVRWWQPIFSSTHGVQLASEYKTSFASSVWIPGPTIEAGPVFGSQQTRRSLGSVTFFQRFNATAP